MVATNGYATPPNISELARLSGYSRTTVRHRLKHGWHPDDFLPVKTAEIRQDFHGPTTPSTQKVQGVERSPVDLVALKRDIQAWTKLHHEVDRLKAAREPYNPRFVFFVLGVSFFVMLAYAAVS
jgi:hypothetical protein